MDSAFCVLPFIAEHHSLDGNKYFCCEGEASKDSTNDPVKAQALRTSIMNGEKIDHCQSCYDVEERNGVSMRIRETNEWMRKAEVEEYINSWTPNTPPKVLFYDVRYSNKCNLQCISCKPLFSSMWEKELGVQLEHHKPADITVADITSSMKVYMAGGEPLVIDEFLSLLETIADSDYQPEVVINTNLTRASDKVKDILSRIKNLTLTISVDAYEQVNEYHRYPMKWDKFLRNLEWAKTLNCTLMFNTVVDAVSVLNLHKLIELEDYISFWNLTFINARPWLEVSNVPERYKSEIISNLNELKRSKFYTQDSEFSKQVTAIIEEVKQPGDPVLLASTINEMDARRNISYKDYLNINLEEIE